MAVLLALTPTLMVILTAIGWEHVGAFFSECWEGIVSLVVLPLRHWKYTLSLLEICSLLFLCAWMLPVSIRAVWRLLSWRLTKKEMGWLIVVAIPGPLVTVVSFVYLIPLMYVGNFNLDFLEIVITLGTAIFFLAFFASAWTVADYEVTPWERQYHKRLHGLTHYTDDNYPYTRIFCSGFSEYVPLHRDDKVPPVEWLRENFTILRMVADHHPEFEDTLNGWLRETETLNEGK